MGAFNAGGGFKGIGPVKGPLVLVRRGERRREEVELALASLIAERETSGVRDRFVTLCARVRDDFSWVARACRWLSDHGRQPIVRLRVPPDDEVMAAFKASGAIAVIELAHVQTTIQRLLLGPGCAPVGELLLAAQRLRAAGVPVVARVGPLLPGVHGGCPEGTRAFLSLLSHLRVADVQDVEVLTGHLDKARLEGLSACLGGEQQMEMARAFGITAGELLMSQGGRPRLTGPRSMAPMVASVFGMEVRAAIMRAGLVPRMAGEIASRQTERLARTYAPIHRRLLAEHLDDWALA